MEGNAGFWNGMGIKMKTKKIRECLRDKENLAFTLWFLWMAVYYGFRMFALTPWYDELYTYYYFISKGPIYAAIHWPLPNNHVGYSVLSGFLDLFGNATIGLRGVSYVCALLNLLLLYRIGRRYLAKGLSFGAVVLYSCMNLVNQLAVQGRGYTLATSCYLLAIYMLQQIGWTEEAEKKKDIKFYVLFSLALTLGLYVLPSSVYWVLPVCVIGGLYLLLNQKYRRLFQLIVSSVIAAVNTFFLYALIWLAIGSNLLSKTEGSKWSGQGHVQIILADPLQAMKTGIDYMLATPYIQSVEREGYLSSFADWLHSLLNYFYSNAGSLLTVLLIIGCMIAIGNGIKAYKSERKEKLFLPLYLVGMTVLTPLLLIIQCKLPYFRVFSYMGTVIALLTVYVLQSVAEWIKTKITIASTGWIKGLVSVIFTGLAIVLLLSKEYNSEYGADEYYARDALTHGEVCDKEALCVTDCYQQYLLKFCYNIECENTQIENADLVLIHKQMADPENADFRWEFYHSYDTIPWEYIHKQMNQTYENEGYILYTRK